MRNKLISAAFALLIAVSAVPIASLTPAAPPASADAACVVVGNELDCGDSGVTGGWNPVNGGSTGGGSTGPYCTSGLASWKWPRASGYPNPVKTASNSVISEFDERFDEAWARIWAGYVASISKTNSEAFYWKGSLYDLGAMFVMINPVTGRLSVASSASEQQTLFNGTIQTGRTAVGRLVQTPIGRPVLNEFTVNVSPAGSTVSTVYGTAAVPEKTKFAKAAGKLTSADIISRINNSVGALAGAGGPINFYRYMAPNGSGFAGAQKYVVNALNASWVSDGTYGKYPYEVFVKAGGVGPFVKVTSATSGTVWPVGTTWYVQAVFPNRKVGFNSYDELRNAFFAAINTEMNRKWVSGGNNYYYYPAFLAPSVNTAPGACGTNKVSIKVSGVTFSFPQRHGWNSGSWNHCRTVNLGSTSLYNNQVASDTGACWMAWLKRPLDAPKLPASSWDDAVTDNITPIKFNGSKLPVQIGTKPDLLVGTVPAPGSGRNFSLSTPIGNTQFNLTMVGFTAELPGKCSTVLPAGVGRTVTLSDGSKACELAATKAVPKSKPSIQLPAFARTPLSRVQDQECVQAVQKSANALLKACGIVYDSGSKSWKYRIIFHTWWDGEYKTSGLPYRGLFNSQWVKFPSSADVAKIRGWDTRFGRRWPQGRSQNPWPEFDTYDSGVSHLDTPMYYAVIPGTSDVPFFDISITQSQSVGG